MADKYIPRLQKKYNEEIVDTLVKELEIKKYDASSKARKNSSKHGNW